MAIHIRNIVAKPVILDDRLPEWARRSNPIIRRQLGIYWRVFTPEIDNIVRWLMIQAAILLLTIQFPVLLTPILMIVLASFLILPGAFYFYFRALIGIIDDSVRAITSELRNDTLMLLRVTPMSLDHIILSKVAAAFWRRMEDLDNVLTLAVFLGTPMVVLVQILSYSPDQYPVFAQLMMIAAMFISIIRLPLEMFMVGMIGMMVGAATRRRSNALVGTATLVFFYFLLINLPRLAPLPIYLDIMVDIVLPLILPILISLISLRITLFLLRRE